MSNRQKMYDTNARAKDWLLANGFNHVVVFGHHKKKWGGGMSWTRIESNGERIMTRQNDLWGLFDGVCIDKGTGKPIFLQFKTNKWEGQTEIMEFTRQHSWIEAIMINVVKGKPRVRKYMNCMMKELTPDIHSFMKAKPKTINNHNGKGKR